MLGETYMDAIRLCNTPFQKVDDYNEWLVNRSLTEFRGHLERAELNLDDIDSLNIIHISGTKGKGSVSAFCESIMRAHGLKTGFFSSPHLIEIRERIRINGLPLTRDDFTKYFFDVYKKVGGFESMGIFRFLTLVALHAFIQEKVDVFIMEVGRGGTYDSTNVIRRPTVTGINLIDFDHMQFLGDTLAKIAWHKAGICKPGRPAFTVPQSEEAVDTILARAKELNAPIHLVPELDDYDWQGQPMKLGISGEHQKRNASLAIQLCRSWIEEHKSNLASFEDIHIKANVRCSGPIAPAFKLTEAFINGLRNCFWPARTQIIKRENVTYYMDGAHTEMGIKACVKWFLQAASEEELQLGKRCVKVLLFNVTRERDPKELMVDLIPCNFAAAGFCPNVTEIVSGEPVIGIDRSFLEIPIQAEHDVCEENRQAWQSLQEEVERDSISPESSSRTESDQDSSKYVRFECVKHALQWLSCGKDSYLPKPRSEDPTPPQPVMEADHVQVLVTGSLYLIGCVIQILDPDIMTNKVQQN
ncbi:folylpolyglutamate synthase, mitochondrial-like [Saccoglossus kowalevskii]